VFYTEIANGIQHTMNDIGKMLIIFGGVVVVIGLVLVVAGRMDLPIGRLPGDVTWRSKSGNSVVYFPIVTSILLSVLLSLVLWVINSFRR
jgi:Protein of unknown function (DUF2905)